MRFEQIEEGKSLEIFFIQYRETTPYSLIAGLMSTG
jgi:hypothetical protein